MGVEVSGTSDPLERLLDLQETDLSIDRLSSKVADIESQEELTAARQRLARAEAALSEVRLSADQVDREQRRLEQDVDSMERKIEAERRRLFDGSVANAKELQSIEAEVHSLQGRKARIEDEIIERMEAREALESRIAQAEAELSEARARVAEIEETSGRELVEAERALAERSAERTGLMSRIEPDLIALYQDLRRQKRGVGAVRLVDGVCQGCHQKLSPVYLERLKRASGVRRCEYCRRILVPS